MKNLILMIVLMVGFITVQSPSVLANADTGSIAMMQDDSDNAIVNAVVSEVPAEENDSGWLSQAINFLLLIVTTVLAGLWAKVRTKVKAVGELFMKAHEYTDDNKLSVSERKDLMKRFYKIIGKDVRLE